jgi:WhiB family redox-sensing transcriptional regulator
MEFVFPPAWVDNAACTRVSDPEIFFPPRGGSSKGPRALCSMCTVRVECLTYALRNNETYGIWGGTSDVQRRKLRKQKRKAEGRSSPAQTATVSVTEKVHV